MSWKSVRFEVEDLEEFGLYIYLNSLVRTSSELLVRCPRNAELMLPQPTQGTPTATHVATGSHPQPQASDHGPPDPSRVNCEGCLHPCTIGRCTTLLSATRHLFTTIPAFHNSHKWHSRRNVLKACQRIGALGIMRLQHTCNVLDLKLS